MGNAAALDDLAQTGGDDVVLHVHAEVRAVGGDAREPLAHAGKQLDGLARADQIIAVETDALRGALADHGVHIGEQAVHFVLIAEAVGLGPELRGRVAEGWNEGVILHIGGAEGLIKVVKERDDRAFGHGVLL